MKETVSVGAADGAVVPLPITGVNVTALPALTDAGVTVAVSVGIYAVPVAVSVIVCIDPLVPPELSVSVTAPVTAPATVGIKTTSMEQSPPIANEVVAAQS